MDDFSDFQMAVGVSTPTNIAGNSTTVKPAWNADPYFADVTNNKGTVSKLGVSVSTPQPQRQIDPTKSILGVGSRLVNYNMEIRSVEGPTKGKPPELSNCAGPVPVSSKPNLSQAPGLLIGEEDKYAALRDLMADSSDLSFCSTSVTTVSTNCTTVTTNMDTMTKDVLPISDDFNSDFGDFQSFSDLGKSSQSLPPLDSQSTNPVVPMKETSSKPTPWSIKGEPFWGNEVVCGKSPGSASIDSSNNSSLCPTATNDNEKSCVSFDTNNDFGDFISVSSSPVILMNSSNNLKAENTLVPTVGDARLQTLPTHKGITQPETCSTTNYDDIREVFSNCDVQSAYTTPCYSENSIAMAPYCTLKTSMIGCDVGMNTFASENLSNSSRSISLSELHNETVENTSIPKQSTPDITHKSFDVSPESKSVCSLDLGSFLVSSNVESSSLGKTMEENSFTIKEQSESQVTDNVTSSSQSNPDVVCLVQNEEKLIWQWQKILKVCRSMIDEALTIFNTAPCSDVIRHIVAEEKGLTYLKSLAEVYKVHLHIASSSRRMRLSVSDSKIREMDELWETLASLFYGTVAYHIVDIHDAPVQTDGSLAICRVCNNFLGFEDQLPSKCGKESEKYHSACANLWINCIDPVLP